MSTHILKIVQLAINKHNKLAKSAPAVTSCKISLYSVI